MLRNRSRRSRRDPPEKRVKLLFPVQTIDMNLKKKRANKETIRRVGEILEEFLIGNLESEFPLRAPSAGPRGEVKPEFPEEALPKEPAEIVEPGREDVGEQQADEEAAFD